MKRRRWLWLGIPLVGIVGVVFLTPTDRYAALNRIGSLTSDHTDPPVFPGNCVYTGLPRPEMVRTRNWTIHVPKPLARQAIAALIPAGEGGRRTSKTRRPGRGFVTEATIYESDRSRNVVATSEMKPPEVGEGLRVLVFEEEAPGIGPKLRRWIRRLLSR